MALPANALTSLQTVKDELGIGAGDNSVDAKLERLVGVASNAIEKFCNRKFARQTETNARVAGYGTPRLTLDRTPIVSITSISLDNETVDPSEYYVEDADIGWVHRQDSSWEWTQPAGGERGYVPEERRYLVTYVGGYYLPWDEAHTRDLPYEIEEACLIAVVSRFRASGKHANAQAETQESGGTPWFDMTLPVSARQLLEPYRRPPV